jgi:hypothetical protein
MPFNQLTPRPFTAQSVQMYAPSAAGVYGLSNAREWIVIKATDDIRGALLAHLDGASTPVKQRRPLGFVFEVCDGPMRPSRRERLVFEYEPVCNE